MYIHLFSESGSISLFITHGGQNSILEAAKAGVKLIVIPQFGDQFRYLHFRTVYIQGSFRNAQAVKERNLGIILSKNDLGDFSKIKSVIGSVLQEKRAHRNVSCEMKRCI